MSSRTRIAVTLSAILLALVVAHVIQLAIPKRDYFIERRGTIVDADVRTERRNDAWHDTAHLVSSTGLEVDLRVLRPTTNGTTKLPLVLLLGGQGTGKDAVDLAGDPGGIAYAAIDYPYHPHRSLHGFWKTTAAIPAIRRTFLNSPPSVSLALTWLLQQPWVDADRVELAGVSLGVPFAAPAGALDQRFSRVWLMHGGADNASWVSHIARREFENEAIRNLIARGTLFAVYGNSFDTRRWITEIAPRPLIIVAARNDDFVPPESQQPFIEAAKSRHIELIWTEGRHVGPHREEELRELLDILRSRVIGADSHLPGPIHPLEPLSLEPGGDRKLVELPSLDDSDAWFRLEIGNLFGRDLDELLVDEMLIERVVGTIDSLPRMEMAERIRPVNRLPSTLITDSVDEDTWELSPENYQRYDALVSLFAHANQDELIDAYRRYYPLLQQAYVGLGYPNGYFNDRVVEVIDHLLATPEVDGPVRLVRPNVLYEFADPELEALSTGQKLLVRIGRENAAQVKSALERIRARIARD